MVGYKNLRFLLAVVNFDSRKQGTIPYYPRPSFVITQTIREEQMII